VPGCNCPRSSTPWTYSVGLTDAGQPELVVLGLEYGITQELVNVVAGRRRAGYLSLEDTSFTHHGIAFGIVDVPDRWVFADQSRMAAWFRHYGSTGTSLPHLRIQQILWPDRFGRLPDDPACSSYIRRCQPVLRDHPMSYPKRDRVAPRAARGRSPRRRRP